MLLVPLVIAATISGSPTLPAAFEKSADGVFVARGVAAPVVIEKDRLSIGGVTMRLEDAADAISIVPEQPLPHVANYFIGNDPAHWRTDVRQFGRLRARNVWDGVDVVYSWNGPHVEFDFIVAPRSDVSRIRMQWSGNTIRPQPDGALLIGERLRLHRPVTRQEDGRSVPSSFLVNDRTVSIAVAAYDPTQTLVIDPVISYSTFFGGTSGDTALAMAVDPAGNIYVAGSTYSTDLPLQSAYQTANRSNGERDAFVAGFDPTGSRLLFSTYLGGAAGREIANAIAIGSDGSVYVAGETHSLDYPVTAGALQTAANRFVGDDGFVARLSPAGNTLIYSTYVAANSNVPSFEFLRSLAVDGAGNAYVAGDTTNPSIPTTSGAYRAAGCGNTDAFVLAVNPAGTALVFGTYLCGSSNDRAYGLALDRAGDVYVVGNTTGADFEQGKTAGTFKGVNDTWVAKLDGRGTRLIYSRLLGGAEQDVPAAIRVDDDGNAYVTGTTRSSDFPVSNGVQMQYAGSPAACAGLICGDAFLAKLDPAGATSWATYLGGNGGDDARALAIDSKRRVAIAGQTASSDFPRAGAIQSGLRGLRDAWAAIVSADGRTLLFSSPVGGSLYEHADAVAFDAGGVLYLAGETSSVDFPVANAYQPAKRVSSDDTDVFVMKISGAGQLPPRRRAVRR